jgi:hypothetical protein
MSSLPAQFKAISANDPLGGYDEANSQEELLMDGHCLIAKA